MSGNPDISPGIGALLPSASTLLILAVLFRDGLHTWVAVARACRTGHLAMLTWRVFHPPRHDAERGLPTPYPNPVGGTPSSPEAEAGVSDDEPFSPDGGWASNTNGRFSAPDRRSDNQQVTGARMPDRRADRACPARDRSTR